ncbi:MAG: ABC transporter ATP-binding protein/permease [Ignavibacteria bacterium]|nr:ABC transporter ATP-binding protein/permease [Ignavibacteria bacterium]
MTYRRLAPYVRPHVGRLLLTTLCMLGFVIFNLASVGLVMPFIDTLFKPVEEVAVSPTATEGMGLTDLKDILNNVIDQAIRDYDRIEVLQWLVVLIFLSYLLKNLFGLARAFIMAEVEQGIMRDLRVDLYTHLHSLSLGFFTEERKGTLISRLTNDVRIINDSLMALVNSVFRDPPQIIAYTVVLFLFNWKLTLLVSVLFPVTGLVVAKIGDALKRASISSQVKMADITAILDETLSGIRIVKAFGMERFETEKFRNETNRFMRIMVGIARRRNLGGPISEMMGVAAVGVVLWFIGQQIILGDSDMTPGGFMFYMTMIYSLIQPLKLFTQVFNSYKEGLAAAERVFEILDEKPAISDRPGAQRITEFRKEIFYDRISFRYPTGRMVLNDVSFRIGIGEVVALVGPSGSGKSTLVDLLPRFYDVIEGAVTIDGVDVRDLEVTSLRSLIGIVTQETILFNDTVRNNIAYGRPDVETNKLIAAAKAANAHDFIMKLPGEYESVIGDRGVKLSGGERQRLSLARAILKNPPILILDEATSALDTESELLVQEAIEHLMEGRTSIVIAHRLSTVQHADRIVVIDAGKVREVGKHEDLLRDGGSLYKRLYDMQFRV